MSTLLGGWRLETWSYIYEDGRPPEFPMGADAKGYILYTPQGQQAFEEIRRRYRAESEFRDSVDRYTSEFERLLTEVSRDDRDGVLTRTYLTSETGKVYTMLAHAAGHFE